MEDSKEISFNEKRIREITLAYYSIPEVKKAIFKFSENRECVPRYFEGFGKRPDNFQYESDIIEQVRKGATSFHCSEELWRDPLELSTGQSEKDFNELRIGWDLCLPAFETLIIKKKNLIRKITIKQLVEKLNLKNPGRYNLSEDLKVFSINPKNYRIEYDSIKDIIIRKQKENEKVIKIIVEDGKEIYVSEDHPVLILTAEGIKQKKAKEISSKDYLLIPLKLKFPIYKEYIDILDLIKEKNYNTQINYKNQKFSWILVDGKNYYEKVSGAIKNIIAKGSTPLDIYLSYETNKQNRENIKIRARRSKLKIFPKIKLDYKFGKLIGYYLSEGSLDKDRIEFVFNKNEVKEGEEVVNLFNDIFDIGGFNKKTIIFHKDANSLKVRINSKILSLLFKDLLGFNYGARNKEIPSWVFNTPINFVAGILTGYFIGDGCCIYEKNNKSMRIESLSVSKKLIEGLSLLCVKLGIHCNIIKRQDNAIIRISGEEGIKKFIYFCMEFVNKKNKVFMPKSINHPSKHSLYPPYIDKNLIMNIRDLNKRINLCRATRLGMRINKEMVLLAANKHLKEIIKNEIFPIKVSKVQKINYKGFFYDIETKKNHNFLQGDGIFTHNCLDVDSPYLEYSKIYAQFLVEALDFHGVKNIGVKFSVSGDTDILIRQGEKIQLTRIDDATNLIKKGRKLEVLSLNKNRKLQFSKIYDYLEHKDILYDIFHSQSKIPLKATGHHSVFVWDKGEVIQKKVTELKKGDFLISFNSRENPFIKTDKELINTFEFSKNQFSRRIINNNVEITGDLMRLIGYFLAEGHTTKRINQIGFSFNINEKEYIEDCKDLLSKITNKNISIRHPNTGSTQVIIHSKEWHDFFRNNCGEKKDKHLPDFAWNLPNNLFLEMLRGYLRGDGYKIGKYGIVAKSVSKTLIKELIWLCKLNNISCSLFSEQNKPHILPQGNVFKGSFVYILKIPKSELLFLEFNRQRNKFSPFPGDRIFPVDGLKRVYYKIKPKMFNHHRPEQMTLKKKNANLIRIKKVLDWFDKYKSLEYDEECRKIVSNYKKLFDSDISVVEIREIIKKDKKRVYDISVEKTEAFFGNDYPILLHNSGSKGFHIIVPWKAFPKQVYGQETRKMFPEWPRLICQYLSSMIQPSLADKIFEQESLKELAKKTGNKEEELLITECLDCHRPAVKKELVTWICSNCKNELIMIKKNKRIPKCPNDDCRKIMAEKSSKEIYSCEFCNKNSNKNPEFFAKTREKTEKLIDADLVLVAPRHLFRMPYSLHEKTALASIVIDKDKIKDFQLTDAKPLKIQIKNFYPDAKKDEAKNILLQALDWKEQQDKFKHKSSDSFSIQGPNNKKNYPDIKIQNLTEDICPPCIRMILKGIKQDGRKRALFILMNFFKSLKLSDEEIFEKIKSWDEKNYNPLKQGYIISQINWYKKNKARLPPNCDKPLYKELGVCHPDEICRQIKNPINYVFKKYFRNRRAN